MAVIEAPYVRDLIDHCEFDTIYHEHLCYFSVTAVSRLFARQGLDADRRQTASDARRLAPPFVQRTGTPSVAVRRLLAEEEALGLDRAIFYQDFAARVRSVQTSLEPARVAEGARSADRGIRRVGEGCNPAQFLRHRWASLDYVVDRSPHKQGNSMPGVHLPIYHPDRLLEAPVPDYLLLLAWNFKDEIMQQQRNTGSGGAVHRADSVAAILSPTAVGSS